MPGYAPHTQLQLDRPRESDMLTLTMIEQLSYVVSRDLYSAVTAELRHLVAVMFAYRAAYSSPGPEVSLYTLCKCTASHL